MLKPWAMPVRDYASRALISVPPEASLEAVYELLLEHDISAVPVVDAAHGLVGIVSTTDLLREARFEVAGPREFEAEAGRTTRTDRGRRPRERSELPRVTHAPRTARELMRRAVISVDHEAPLSEAAAAMITHRIHRVVVTRGGKSVGVLSTSDAMRAVLDARIETPLERVMTQDIVTIDEGDSIRLAIQRLDDANVRGLVVVDGNWPVGVFTHAEAIRARAFPALLDRPVERVMSYETICLDVNTPLYRVAGHAIQMRVRRILAVQDRGLRGVATGFDLVRIMTV